MPLATFGGIGGIGGGVGDGDLDAFVEERRREDNLPGVAVVVVAGGEIVLHDSWGVRDVATGEPLGPDAAFRVGSLTKLVTATAALRLQERGRLSLDEPVRRYVPWLALDGPAGSAEEVVGAITLRHLLSHRAGLPRGRYLGEPVSSIDRLRSLERMRLAFPPGERLKYSNLGYALAAHALERIADRPWPELARELVLGPAGMEGCGFGEPAAHGPLAAIGHQRGHYRSLVRPGDVLRRPPRACAAPGAGDLVAPAGALGRLLIALLGGGLLSEDSRAELGRPQGPVRPGMQPGTGPLYGLSLRVVRRFGRRCLAHDGGHSGFFSLLRFFPEEGVGGIALGNRCSAFHALDEILDRALAPWLPGRPRTFQPDLDPFVGRYAGPERSLRFRSAGGRLWMRHVEGNGEEMALLRQGLGRFVQPRGPFSEHLLRFGLDRGEAWDCTTGPLRWAREGPSWPLLWDGPAHPPPASGSRSRALAGVYTHPVIGDVRVYLREGRPIFSFFYAEESPLRRVRGGGYRIDGGSFDGEPAVFEMIDGEAVALEAGYMRFERRPAVPEDLL
jgi:CubicO group peptidase (beta-lactamase class C family)